MATATHLPNKLIVDRQRLVFDVEDTSVKIPFNHFPIWSTMQQTWRPIPLYQIYLWVVSGMGLLLLAASLWRLPDYSMQWNFWLLMILAVVAVPAATSIAVEKSGVTYAIGAAAGTAALFSWGLDAALLTISLSNYATWQFKPANAKAWKKSWPQLFFNMGMLNLAMLAAAGTLWAVQQWAGHYLIQAYLVAWPLAAVVYSEVNIWLLIGILRLQHGASFSPWQFWREERWSTNIDTLLLGIGGGVLAFAVTRFDWLGIAIFFLPILLSAYAFRVYVTKMRAHLNNLEEIITQRTSELAESHAALSQRAEELAHQKEQLATLNQQKDAFLAVLTHDMVTPLTSMQLCSDILLARHDAPANEANVVQVLRNNQRILFDIVQNILDLEKLEATGTLSLEKSTVDLNKQIADVVNLVGAEAKNKGVRLEALLDEVPLFIEADTKKFERVLINLVSNAIKYTPNAGSVMVSAQPIGDSAVITVEDTGYGIPADQIPHVFDRFHRIAQHKKKAIGTGLGLTITKMLIEEHGGTIHVTSEEGVGSCFTVMLPL